MIFRGMLHVQITNQLVNFFVMRVVHMANINIILVVQARPQFLS